MICVDFKKARKGFLLFMYVSGQFEQKNFMLVVTETNHGLAYDRDVKVPLKHFMMSYLLPW